MKSKKNVVRIILVAALFALFFGALWFWMSGRFGIVPWGPARAMRGGFFPLWGLPVFLFIVFIIGGLGRRLLWGSHQGPMRFGPHPEVQTALEILAKRYASGEVTKEQYEEIKRDLSV